MRAGRYDRKFTRLYISKTIEATYGEHERAWTVGLDYWASIEELSATAIGFLGGTYSDAKVKIRIRNLVELNFEDRLQDIATGETFWIDGFNRDISNDETIVYAHVIGER